jgi:hypothetical protein
VLGNIGSGGDWRGRAAARASILTQNIADSEVLSEVSQIVLRIDFVFAMGNPRFFNFH